MLGQHGQNFRGLESRGLHIQEVATLSLRGLNGQLQFIWLEESGRRPDGGVQTALRDKRGHHREPIEAVVRLSQLSQKYLDHAHKDVWHAETLQEDIINPGQGLIAKPRFSGFSLKWQG